MFYSSLKATFYEIIKLIVSHYLDITHSQISHHLSLKTTEHGTVIYTKDNIIFATYQTLKARSVLKTTKNGLTITISFHIPFSGLIIYVYHVFIVYIFVSFLYDLYIAIHKYLLRILATDQNQHENINFCPFRYIFFPLLCGLFTNQK